MSLVVKHDNPLLTRINVKASSYSLKFRNVLKTVPVEKFITEEMTVLEARKCSLSKELDVSLSDNAKIIVTYKAIINEVENKTYLHMCHTNRLWSSKARDIRCELADAAYCPYQFVPDWLFKATIGNYNRWVISKTDFLENPLTILGIVFLDVRDSGNHITAWSTRCKSGLLVIKDNYVSLDVENASRERFSIEVPEKIRSLGIIRDFILFFPSNVNLVYDLEE